MSYMIKGYLFERFKVREIVTDRNRVIKAESIYDVEDFKFCLFSHKDFQKSPAVYAFVSFEGGDLKVKYCWKTKDMKTLVKYMNISPSYFKHRGKNKIIRLNHLVNKYMNTYNPFYLYVKYGNYSTCSHIAYMICQSYKPIFNTLTATSCEI